MVLYTYGQSNFGKQTLIMEQQLENRGSSSVSIVNR